MAHYLDPKTYAALVEALLHLDPDPVTGEPTADAIKTALGEIGDLWPASVIPEVLKHSPEEAPFGEFWPG